MGTRSTQPDLGRHPTTANAKTKWTKELNKIVMKCYLKSEPKKRGFRKRMLTIWKDIGLFEVTEQQLAGQALCIKNRGWLSEVEIEEIKRVIENRVEAVQVHTEEDEQQEITEVVEEIIMVRGFAAIDCTGKEREILQQIERKLNGSEIPQPINLKNFDRKKVREKTETVSKVTSKITTNNITETNLLIRAGANVVNDLVGAKKVDRPNEIPWWKRRIQNQIAIMRRDISKLEEWENLKNKKEKQRLESRYHVKAKGVKTVIGTETKSKSKKTQDTEI